jgi:hypothetical protein
MIAHLFNPPVRGMPMFLGLVLVSVLLLVIVYRLPGRRERKSAIFIAADPETVWNAYFTHVRGCNYRPATRLLSSEILSRGPLTVRDTWQCEYVTTPLRTISVYEIYEPHHRYRVRAQIEPAVVPPNYEEGELRQEANGTWLRYTATSPSGPDPRGKWLVQWLARRQDERNLKALKDVCEGRQPEAHRGPFPQLRSWQRGLIYLGLAALVPMMFLAAPFLWLLTVPMAGVLLLHWGNWVMRVCAVPTSKKASTLPCNATTP